MFIDRLPKELTSASQFTIELIHADPRLHLFLTVTARAVFAQEGTHMLFKSPNFLRGSRGGGDKYEKQSDSVAANRVKIEAGHMHLGSGVNPTDYKQLRAQR